MLSDIKRFGGRPYYSQALAVHWGAALNHKSRRIMAVQNRIGPASRVGILQGVADPQILHKKDSRLLPRENMSLQIWLRLDDFDLRPVQPFEYLSSAVNLHRVKKQFLKARVETKSQAAGILHSGLVLHESHHAGETLVSLRIFLALVQNVVRAFRGLTSSS